MGLFLPTRHLRSTFFHIVMATHTAVTTWLFILRTHGCLGGLGGPRKQMWLPLLAQLRTDDYSSSETVPQRDRAYFARPGGIDDPPLHLGAGQAAATARARLILLDALHCSVESYRLPVLSTAVLAFTWRGSTRRRRWSLGGSDRRPCNKVRWAL